MATTLHNGQTGEAPKTPSFQFSLRALFIITFVVAALCTLYAFLPFVGLFVLYVALFVLGVVPAVAFSIRDRSNRDLSAAEAGFVAVAWLGAVIAVSFIYYARGAIILYPWYSMIWAASIAVFAGVPLLVGILRGRSSRSAILIAGTLLLSCPAVYALAQLLQFDRFGESFFLATGSTMTFASAGWAANCLHARQWIRMFATVLINIAALGAIVLMISIFMYLE